MTCAYTNSGCRHAEGRKDGRTVRNYMTKRRIMLFFVLLVGACTSAIASEVPVVGTIELSPAYLTGPGEVTVSITVSNATDADLTDPVTLFDPAAQPVTDFGTNGEAMLKSGETLTWTGVYAVNQRTLDNGSVVYYLKYTNRLGSGEAIEQNLPLRAKIELQSEAALMDVSRTITPSVAQEDQEVVVLYTISNAGTVNLTNIVLTENKDIHAEPLSIAQIDVGKTAEIRIPVTMGKENLTSGATITYQTADAEEEKTYVVEDQTILYGNSDLTATLTSSSKGVVANSVFTLTLQLKNGGTVDFSNISVTDPTLGMVFSNETLEAGKSLTLEKELTLPATSSYQFTVTAIDATGTESVTGTEQITVTAVDPADALNLTLVATPDKTEAYGNPATVRFSLVITNDSRVEATDVTISHGDVELYTFLSIPAGESRTLTRDTALSTSGKFQFTATAEDPLENSSTFRSNEMQIAIYAPTPVPTTPTPPPNPTPEPTFNPATIIPIRDPSIGALPKGIQSVLLPLLIVTGVLLAAACVLLIIATKRRHDQKRASEAAYDHLERAKRRDYITPAEEPEPEEGAESEQTPEGKPEKKKKKKAKTLTKEEQDAQMKNRRIVGESDDDLGAWELPHMKYAREAGLATSDDDQDSISTIGQGLYDEEMTSDLSAYGTHDAEDGMEPAEDSVMYEQPYEDDTYAAQEDGALPTYDDAYTIDGDGLYEDGYTDDVTAVSGATDPVAYDTYDDYTDDNDGYTRELAQDYAAEPDGQIADEAYDAGDTYDAGDAYDVGETYDAAYQEDFDPAYDMQPQSDPAFGDDTYDDFGYGDAFDNEYSGRTPILGENDEFAQGEDTQQDKGRRRSRQARPNRDV